MSEEGSYCDAGIADGLVLEMDVEVGVCFVDTPIDDEYLVRLSLAVAAYLAELTSIFGGVQDLDPSLWSSFDCRLLQILVLQEVAVIYKVVIMFGHVNEGALLRILLILKLQRQLPRIHWLPVFGLEPILASL